ncbi:unnamed protein product [Lactuca virosa]|uniref:Uncharacterized protein n=1 Tax=Lactuca virosa TaxID=75947 RepID=A0AAU9M216_9ASTR|nr:unnamed protein product [Lactuca virosa]
MKILDHIFGTFQRASAIRDVDSCHAAAEPSRSTSIDHVSVDVGIESSGYMLSEEEFVADSKEGVLHLVNKQHLDVRFEKSDVGKAPRLLHFGHVKSPLVGDSEVRDSSGVAFAPAWSLKGDSRLSLFESAVDFAKNAFPHDTRSEMANISLSDLIGSFRFTTAQSATFFAEVANRLERFLAVDDDLARMVGEMQLLHLENAVL